MDTRVLLLTVALLTAPGCTLALLAGGAAAGAGTVAYVRGDLESTEEMSLDRAWTAARAALADLGLAVTSTEKDGVSATIWARGSEDKRIRVSLRRTSERLTHVRIRVDYFGDEQLSRIILEKLRARAREA